MRHIRYCEKRREVIEYVLEGARIIWSLSTLGVIRILWCPPLVDEEGDVEHDDVGGLGAPVYGTEVHHTDSLNPEQEHCLGLFGPNKEREDDNGIGLQFRLPFIVPPALGETVREYVTRVFKERSDSRVIEKAMAPSILERIGDIPILPKAQSFFDPSPKKIRPEAH